ncbi:MAG: hypothetical protein DRP84_11265 [Spirochaetes bacterium]|nr:MAG: hypothetical protein DRP84_11265 [Spirochaetota bacterium]
MGAGWSYFASSISGVVITILIKIKYFPERGWFKILYAMYGPIFIGFMVILIAGNMVSPKLPVLGWFNLIYYIGIISLCTLLLLLFIDLILLGIDERRKFVGRFFNHLMGIY